MGIEQARRCGKIVNSLLQLGQREPTPKIEIEIADIVHGAVQLTESYASDSGIKIDLQCADQRSPVWACPVEIEQVFINLLRNAVEAEPE
jgi:signal transduction histidine kinase